VLVLDEVGRWLTAAYRG